MEIHHPVDGPRRIETRQLSVFTKYVYTRDMIKVTLFLTSNVPFGVMCQR